VGERTVTATVGGSATFMLRTEGGVGGICTTPTDKLEEEEGEEGGVVRTEEPLPPRTKSTEAGVSIAEGAGSCGFDAVVVGLNSGTYGLSGGICWP